MSVYASADQLYVCVRTTFERVQTRDPFALDALAQSNLAIRFRCREPRAEIFIDGRQRPAVILYRFTERSATLEIDLNSDTLHKIMLGEMGILKALGRRRLKVKGPLMKAKALAHLFRQSQEIYPQVLQEHGLM